MNLLMRKNIYIPSKFSQKRLEIFSTMKIQVVVFCVVTPCNWVVGHQRFGGLCCLHLQPPETMVSYHIATRCHNSKDHNIN